MVRILHPSNVDKEKLMEYAIKAAQFSTEWRSKKLPHTEWSRIPRGPPPGVPDVCIFDFTNLYAARVAARVNVRKGQPLLSMIVGDSLLEPFWPEGTGCARGFLSAMDCGWLVIIIIIIITIIVIIIIIIIIVVVIIPIMALSSR